jgi:hypothetical protein
MENNLRMTISRRIRELKPIRDKLNKQVETLKSTIWGYVYLAEDPENENCVKAQKELPILQLQLKKVHQHILALEKKYKFDYHPEDLTEEERKIYTPIDVPNDDNDPYEIDNGLLGVNRDLFNKLGTHRWANDDDLQQMYEISQRPAGPWRKHFAFALKRPRKPKPDDNK